MSHEMFLSEDFHGRNAKNVYEAIIAIARRARQIGEAQRKEMDAYLSQVEMLEKFQEDEESYDEPAVHHEPVLQFEKPTVLALREMASDKLELIRGEEEVEDMSKPPEEQGGSFGSKLDLSGDDDEVGGPFPTKLSLEEDDNDDEDA